MQTYFGAMSISFAGDAQNGIVYVELGIFAAGCVLSFLLRWHLARNRSTSLVKPFQVIHNSNSLPIQKIAPQQASDDAETDTTCTESASDTEGASDSGDGSDVDCQRSLLAMASGKQPPDGDCDSEGREDDGFALTLANVNAWNRVGARLSTALCLSEGRTEANFNAEAHTNRDKWLAVGARMSAALRLSESDFETDSEAESEVDHEQWLAVGARLSAALRLSESDCETDSETVGVRLSAALRLRESDFETESETESEMDHEQWLAVGARLSAALRLSEDVFEPESEAESDMCGKQWLTVASCVVQALNGLRDTADSDDDALSCSGVGVASAKGWFSDLASSYDERASTRLGESDDEDDSEAEADWQTWEQSFRAPCVRPPPGLSLLDE